MDFGIRTSEMAQTLKERQPDLMKLSRRVEAQFLSEMLKSAKVGEPPSSLNGGVGEAHFASFLRDAYAQRIVETNGLGLAEHIFNSLSTKRW